MQQPEKQINAPAGMPLPERRRRRRSSGICATSGVRVQPQEEQQQVATRGTVLTDSDQFYFNWYAHIDVHEEMIKVLFLSISFLQKKNSFIFHCLSFSLLLFYFRCILECETLDFVVSSFLHSFSIVDTSLSE